MPDNNNAGVHYIRYVPASYAQIHAYDYDNDYYVNKISAKKELPITKQTSAWYSDGTPVLKPKKGRPKNSKKHEVPPVVWHVMITSQKKEQPAKKTEKANSPKKDSATSKLQHDMKPNRKKQKSQSHNGKTIEKHSSGLTSSFGSLPQFQQLLAEMSYPD